MMISGSLFVPKVEMPRIQKFAPSAPGSPDDCTETMPAMRPAKAVVRLLEVTFSSEGFTACTAPTRLSFFWTPKPTTTTSLMLFSASKS